ncbi:MAG: hypothetical protein HQM08_11730 [Candidatus Riflebacteria bacterium]|nr:hypothetical protein [Candidatus Riflebacteria bacterium]
MAIITLFAGLPKFLTDVHIETAILPGKLDNMVSSGVLWQAAPGRFLLNVPDVGRYLVENGQCILIDATSKANEADVLRFLHMMPFAALFYQRNMPVFHAAAVAMPKRDGCILLAGDSISGKSSLLATLLQRGWWLLADDLVVADLNKRGQLIVFPTFPEVILWQDVREKLQIVSTNHRFPQIISYSAQFLTESLPLRAVYWLSVFNKNEVELSEIGGKDRFQAMGLLSYNTRIADALLDRFAYFPKVSVFARTISVYRLRRPRGRWSMLESADLVERNKI